MDTTQVDQKENIPQSLTEALGMTQTTETKAEAPKLELDSKHLEVLKAGGVDVSKIGSDPEATVKAINLLAAKNKELAIRSRADEAVRTAIKKSTVDVEVFDGEGKLDETKLKAIVHQARRASASAEAIQALFDKGHITEEAVRILSEEDPTAIKLRVEYVGKPSGAKGGETEENTQEAFNNAVSAAVAKALRGHGIGVDLGGRSPVAGQTGALQPPPDYASPQFTHDFVAGLQPKRNSGNGQSK